jgi:hypothetical protein
VDLRVGRHTSVDQLGSYRFNPLIDNPPRLGADDRNRAVLVYREAGRPFGVSMQQSERGQIPALHQRSAALQRLSDTMLLEG